MSELQGSKVLGVTAGRRPPPPSSPVLDSAFLPVFALPSATMDVEFTAALVTYRVGGTKHLIPVG